jgi:hypothetical protein
MSNKQHTRNNTSHTKDSSIDNAKRKTLKTIGATTAGVAATSTAGVMAGSTLDNALQNPLNSDKAESASMSAQANSVTQHVSINIQKNRQGLEDWVLIENMTEAPLVAKTFTPRYVQYDNTVLDLNALLTRQQKGKKQLELWPNHAWTHSTRGATRAPHTLRPVDAQTATVNRDTRSIQIGARIDSNGQVFLSSVS